LHSMNEYGVLPHCPVALAHSDGEVVGKSKTKKSPSHTEVAMKDCIKKNDRPAHNGRPCRSFSNGNTDSSGQSVVSSITFTERDVDEEDVDALMATLYFSEQPHAVELQHQQHLVCQPYPPIPKASMENGSCENCVERKQMRKNSLDSPPTKPRRSCSFGSITSDEKKTVAASKRNDLFVNKSEELRPLSKFTINKEGQNDEMDILSRKAAIFLSVVDVKNRNHGLLKLKKCFVGSEAVDRMLSAGLATTRKEAVDLGRDFVDKLSLFRHVMGTHTFKDKRLLYRICYPGTIRSIIPSWFPLFDSKSRARTEEERKLAQP